MVSACNWVDSTGVQPATISAGIIGSEPETLGDSSIRAIALPEATTTEFIPVQNQPRPDSDWRWGSPYQTGALPACNGFDGFSPELAAPTLAEACTDASNCSIRFDFSRAANDEVSFNIRMPPLKANVGLAYTLTTTSEQGESSEEFVTLCAISINEAPEAQDDIFDITAGVETVVRVTDAIHLLSNDFDDLDIRNLPLQVNPTAISQPKLAGKFELFSDGGFIYQPRADLVTSSGAPLIDTFRYAATDGQLENNASVTLRIRPANSQTNLPPVIFSIDDEVIGAGNRFNVEIDAEDPENDALTFSLSDDTPDFVSINSATGTMTGIADTPGSYTLTVIASDGQNQTRASFALFVQTAVNRPPFANDITNTTVRDNFSYDVAVFFGDPDGDPLVFTATGIPADTEISPDGVISGVSSDANRGRHIIRVFGDDGRGGTASDGFRLTIQ